ncbi:MAG: MFS transporter [Thermoanaerobacteraceae bacterium]
MTDKIKFYYPLFVASFSFFLSYYTRLTWSILSVYVPFHPTVIQDAHVFAIYFFGYIVIQIPAGFIADKYSCGKIISISLLVLAFATFLSGISDNILKEYIASFIMGVSAGFVYPASLKVVNFYYKKNKSLYIGYYSIAWPFAIVAAGVFLPPIAIYIGWRWGYYFPAILSLILAFLSYPLDTQPTEQKKFNISLLKDKKVMLISIGGFLFFLSYWSITLYAYKYFTQIGINKTLSGYIFSTMAIAGLFS